MRYAASKFSSLLVFLSLGAFALGCGKEKKAAGGPLEVSVVEVQPQDVAIYTDFVGSIDGVENAEIRARVAGYLEEVHFKEGSRVKEGDLLFTIDPVLSEAEVRKAKGDVARARASASKSKADVERLTPLVATNAVSRQELDHALAARDSANAEIAAAEGSLATAQASLSYTKVRSPIDGIVGIRQASVGSLVGQGEPTLLTTVSQLDPVRVRFPISEQLYLKHAAALNRLVDIPSGPGRLKLILSDGSTYGREGHLTLIDRAVSISTGSILLESRFPNPDNILRPGQFARVRARTDMVKGALAVPQRAVLEKQSIHELFILKGADQVERRAVTVGERVGRYWLITKGLNAGDKVLIEGVQKVRPETRVKPKLIPLGEVSPPPPAAPEDEAPAPEGEAAAPKEKDEPPSSKKAKGKDAGTGGQTAKTDKTETTTATGGKN